MRKFLALAALLGLSNCKAPEGDVINQQEATPAQQSSFALTNEQGIAHFRIEDLDLEARIHVVKDNKARSPIPSTPVYFFADQTVHLAQATTSEGDTTFEIFDPSHIPKANAVDYRLSLTPAALSFKRNFEEISYTQQRNKFRLIRNATQHPDLWDYHGCIDKEAADAQRETTGAIIGIVGDFIPEVDQVYILIKKLRDVKQGILRALSELGIEQAGECVAFDAYILRDRSTRYPTVGALTFIQCLNHPCQDQEAPPITENPSCYTELCLAPNCMFGEPFDREPLDRCRWDLTGLSPGYLPTIEGGRVYTDVVGIALRSKEIATANTFQYSFQWSSQGLREGELVIQAEQVIEARLTNTTTHEEWRINVTSNFEDRQRGVERVEFYCFSPDAEGTRDIRQVAVPISTEHSFKARQRTDGKVEVSIDGIIFGNARDCLPLETTSSYKITLLSPPNYSVTVDDITFSSTF